MHAGSNIIVEEFLDGEEASFFALLDGHTCLALASAQVHAVDQQCCFCSVCGVLQAADMISHYALAWTCRQSNQAIQPTHSLAAGGLPCQIHHSSREPPCARKRQHGKCALLLDGVVLAAYYCLNGRMSVGEEGPAGSYLRSYPAGLYPGSEMLVHFSAMVQDHKAVGEGDTGPNTGGMGAYSPAPAVTAQIQEQLMQEIVQPTADALVAEGCPYRGVLFAGLMIKDGKVVPGIIVDM